jgi:hypothetical protein
MTCALVPQDHITLPASYMKSCQEFFKELGNERQATGAKLQATSCKKILRRVGTRVKNRFNRKI